MIKSIVFYIVTGKRYKQESKFISELQLYINRLENIGYIVGMENQGYLKEDDMYDITIRVFMNEWI